ncbi:PAS domain S-box protein [Lutibacter sp.]|uniref:PAS domain S-box protein n=1 Tax=Lutibacter sp. TaxID=1925666 RepID=UPI0027366995|nr:PAS domain S-box protein [Lutibacter sp.]MDP3312233.1 PAS domain S-box protein [Lutibacter sp.]
MGTLINNELTINELKDLAKNQNQELAHLREVSLKYQNLLDNSIDGIYRSTPEGKFIEVNNGLVKMLGYKSKDEVLALDIATELFFDVQDRLKNVIEFKNGKKEIYRIKTNNNSAIWVEDFGKNICDESGNVLFYEGIIRDVSERKKTAKIQKVLLQISQEGYKIQNLKDFNEFIKNTLGKIIDTSNFYIAFYNEEKQTLNIPFITGEDADEEFPVGKSMTGYLIKNNKPLLLKSEEIKRLINTNEINLIGTFPEVWLGVPLVVDNKVIGAIVVQNYKNENAYEQSDLEILEFVSSYISLAVQQNQKKEELKKFSMAVEQSANTIVITDTDGNIEYVNSKFTETSGYTYNEALGQNPRILNSGNQPKELYKVMWENISSGDEWSGEFQNKSKKGNLYWERVVITPIKNFEGKIINYLSIKEDITKQKEIQHEINVSKQILRKVLDNIPTKVFWKDINSTFLGINKASFEEMGVTTEEEVVGKSDFDFHNFNDAEKYRADELAIMQKGEPKLNYHETQIKNGKTKNYITSKIPFFDEDNNIIGIVGTSEDITKRLETEKKLKKATEQAIAGNLSKSIFLSNMSHEIRTPMNAILGYSQLLQDDANLSKEQLSNLKVINKSGEHLLNLINDILDMSKIEAGRIILKPSNFDLTEMIKEVESLFKIKAIEKNIDLNFTICKEIPAFICADESKIRQVVINLVGNALKFTAVGFVNVVIQNFKNNSVQINVIDSGKGILKEEQKTVFKPFEQAKKDGEVKDGTGLGLAISKKFAKLMGGDIKLKSEYNKGSEFSFKFKYEIGKTEVTKKITEVQVTSLCEEMKGYKVAIVDDRFENRDILFKKLHPLGFDLRMAENGQEAIDLYKLWKPDLILMDVVMPVMNGVEATREILRLAGNHEVKIFVVSASALESEQKEIMDIGATIFIKKPIIFNSLLAEMQDKAGIKFEIKEPINKEAQILCATPSDIPENFKTKMLAAADEGDFLVLNEMLVVLEKETNMSFKFIEDCVNEMEFEQISSWLNT